MSRLALHTVQDELRKLSGIGFLISWSNGYHRFYRGNRDHPIYPHLLRVVQLSEKLPRIKQSALRLLFGPGIPSKQTRPKAQPLRTDWPPGWDLFSRLKKARRL
jgi:hypothetical protein